MKRLAVMLLLVTAMVLSACQTPATPTTAPKPAETPKAPAAERTLGLVLSTLNNPFFVSLRDGAQKSADAAGVKLIVVDAQDDSAKMTAGIEDLISKKVSALLINPTDADAVVPSVQKANAANIPVFTVDRGAAGGTVVSHIASDNVAGGKMAAEFLCKTIGAKGNVVELQGIAGTSAARDRGQGFNEYMKASCTGATIVAAQTADFNRDKGLTVFENILQAQPEIAGVFAHNDEMILGALQAADAAKRTGITFVGFDAVDDAVKAVNEGKLAATVAQQPAVMGQAAVETALKALDGKTVEKSIPVALSLVTNEGAVKPAAPADVTMGLVLSTLNNPFFVSLRDGAQAAADAAGIKLIVVDAQDDSAKMTAGIEDLISKKVSALLINPTDADAVVPSVQKANAANIPVFTVDRGAAGGTVVSHIASDNVAGGMMAAEFLCKTIGGKGNVVELQGIAGTSAARDRGQGFNDYMKASCTGATIVAAQTADFNRAKGLSVFENILQAQPDIVGVFAHNDEMILGAIQAADAAQRTGITFVGFDAVDDAVKAVNDGKLAATVAQQPALMGQLAVETAAKALKGDKVEAAIPVALSLVTKDAAAGGGVTAKGDYTLGLVLST
ncbi:MAG: ribose ABC transporter substrate-binding protein RbsB, partial [Thermoflexales bacterium]|nr:ribose ABC transporter substrate-binding protein RbsB [Thermoflexales bacterium]